MSVRFLILLSLLWISQAQALILPNQQPVKGYDCKNCDSLARDTLGMSWPVTLSTPLGHETRHHQTSRKYRVRVTLNQLRAGVSIYTSAPGAIIRITPVNPQITTKPEFRIKNNQGVNLSLRDASSLFSADEALQRTAFAGNTLALAALKPEFGFGEFIVSTTTDAKKESSFIIHVFDHNSTAYLHVETDKASYFYGDNFTATLTLADKNQNHTINNITASIVDAEGKKTPLNLTQLKPNVFQAKTSLTSEKNIEGGNWYLEAQASSGFGDNVLLRQAHSAFSYTIPSAAVREITHIKTAGLNFSTIIEVATDSRYVLQTVLFGSDKQGKLHPIQTAQSAAWLTVGQQKLNFSFDSTQESSYKAPYYLGYIRLTDFGQIKPVFAYDTPIALTRLS